MVDSLTFLCPGCQTKLTLPAALAGVTGPCPICQTVIRAPSLPAGAAPPPATAAVPQSLQGDSSNLSRPSDTTSARGPHQPVTMPPATSSIPTPQSLPVSAPE